MMRKIHDAVTSDATGFKAVYNAVGLYDTLLLPHYFNGSEDTTLVAERLTSIYGAARPALRIAEFGCGTGRVTEALAPYAGELVAIDSSRTMLERFAARFPAADIQCADTRQAVPDLLARDNEGAFDIVGAFWSLSYPIGDCFETMTADGIMPTKDPVKSRQLAGELVRGLVRLLADDGHLLVLFFDSESREQRVVTRAWERIAPFPAGGRGYTRNLLLEELQGAEDAGIGYLIHTRSGGVARAANRDAAHVWFNQLHFKNVSALVNDPQVQGEVSALIDDVTQPSGEVLLPCGAHLIEFHVASPRRHLP